MKRLPGHPVLRRPRAAAPQPAGYWAAATPEPYNRLQYSEGRLRAPAGHHPLLPAREPGAAPRGDSQRFRAARDLERSPNPAPCAETGPCKPRPSPVLSTPALCMSADCDQVPLSLLFSRLNMPNSLTFLHRSGFLNILSFLLYPYGLSPVCSHFS